MDYQTYHEHVEDICQSVDISRQENKITSDRVSEVHEQEESRSVNNHDISDNLDDQEEDTTETEDQDTEDDYEVNKTAQKKFVPYKPKSKAAMVTLLPSSMYSTLSAEDKQVWSKLSPEGRAIIIKRINEASKPSDTVEKRVSSHHERVEIHVHEETPSDETTKQEAHISEREFSPGQLELQRRVAFAQSKREVKQHVIDDTEESTREVRMAKSSCRSQSKTSLSRRSRQSQRAQLHRQTATQAARSGWRRTSYYDIKGGVRGPKGGTTSSYSDGNHSHNLHQRRG